MSVQVKRRRDTAANVAVYAGAQGELIVDTTNNRVTVHDGVTPGGFAAAKLSEVLTAARTAVMDANYAVLVSDRTIAFTAITVARAVALPAASSYPTGVSLRVVDESGNASSSKMIAFTPNGSDLIDGLSSAAISSPYGYLVLQSNGAVSPNGKWTIVDQATSGLPFVGIGTAADPGNPLSVFGASALFNGTNFNFTLNKSAVGNTASILFQDGFSGRAQVGLTGDDNFHFKVSPNGSSWLDALDFNANTGQASINYGIASGEALSWRNRLRNASFAVNQRNVSGAVTLSAGAYGHDGVKGGASGATYTFATSGADTTLIITSGSLILPIESSLIEGGAYTVQNAGTAQARVWQGTGYSGSGAYASAAVSPTAAPLTFASLTAATQTNVEFSTGTVLRPQFEFGYVATAFERRPPGVELFLCHRYYFRIAATGSYSPFGLGSGVSPTDIRVELDSPAPMRGAPTLTSGGTFIWSSGNSVTALTLVAATPNLLSIDCTTTGAAANGCYILTDAGSANAWIAGSAEI
ncbi:hypothetical protein [uncultured Rhodoblastus sp.]|uniref:hyaluronate lyase N-terminal domain-containing protein n=1 Tax=uncultured Rhodoblastus sp. TaxID=543037 RepID=UPI0025DB362B|nr:hypothetical protein [uncultured Rhodoblastus sp.]